MMVSRYGATLNHGHHAASAALVQARLKRCEQT